MRIENQVASLEQSKRLNELGIGQGVSLFYYDNEKIHYNVHPEPMYFNAGFCFSAFTASELMAMLPCYDGEQTYLNVLMLFKDTDNVGYYYYRNNIKSESVRYNTLCEALAAMLIHLLETNQITAADCNSRLANA